MKKKEKLREKIYDLVYDGSLDVEQTDCYHDEGPCGVSCYTIKRSEFYDKLLTLLEDSRVYLDKTI